MGMFSEVAIDATIRAVVLHIDREIAARQDSPEAVAALKALGRKVLTEFEWDTPAWAREFAKRYEA